MKRFDDLPRSLLVAPPGTKAEIRFRPARMSDLKALHEACFAERPLTQFGDSFRRSLEAQRAGRRLHVLAVLHERPIASGQLVGYSSSVEIADLAVAPPHRGRGMGTALIAILLRVAAFVGYDGVEISVMKGNERALALYRRLGFIVDRQFSMSGSASVLVLHKSLSAGGNDPTSEELIRGD